MPALATQHIWDLEERNKELRARIAQEMADLERLRFLNRLFCLSDNSFSPGGLDVPLSSRSLPPSNGSPILHGKQVHLSLIVTG
jgi:hypothetical protein